MNIKKLYLMLLLSTIGISTSIAQSENKIQTNLRVGAGVMLNAGIDGVGFNMELPFGIGKFIEISPAVAYSKMHPNYETDFGYRYYPDFSASISYGGKSNELGNSNFLKSANSQLGIDLNLRFKPLALLHKQGKIDIAVGFGYGYKSGIDIKETSEDNGNYWITHSTWNSMEWNPFLLDVNYKLSNRHKLGLHFNTYGGNEVISELGIHFITKL
ncbi:hypothetical protein [Ancylomarina longa]|uniref:Outer membrane protein beta-barrel domain-containing protein n=1 Tax=Ancylomarina longa TaxID=2487017 RepID=A0A434AG34_9BACT|nr:hypothetical protein [Ancylomarina longa]RUT73331.1 hypothetical protein DLK05_13745 [Ancylomarina longa]